MFKGNSSLSVMIVAAVTVVFILLVFVWPMTVIKNKTVKACFIENPYSAGQMVLSVLDGRKGMVVSTGCRGYYVRFSSLTETIPNHFVGSGGNIGKEFYSKEFMRPFEMQPVQ